MCIVCRSKKSKEELLRLVLSSDYNNCVVGDTKASGRGTYICKDGECISKCIKSKVLNKVFKKNIPDNIYEELKKVEQILEKLKAYLGFAIKSGKVIYGVDNIEAKANKVAIVIFDDSLSDNSCNKLINIAKRYKLPVYNLDILLDELLGKNNCKAIGILSKDLAKAIKELNILKEVQN